MTQHPVQLVVIDSLKVSKDIIQKKFGISDGVVDVLMLETLIVLLNMAAPLELGDYLTVLAEELPKGTKADFQRIAHQREELSQILTMVMTEVLRPHV